MKKTLKYILILFTILILQSCIRTKVVDVKSPCVSTEDGPCSIRTPINSWMSKA